MCPQRDGWGEWWTLSRAVFVCPTEKEMEDIEDPMMPSEEGQWDKVYETQKRAQISGQYKKRTDDARELAWKAFSAPYHSRCLEQSVRAAEEHRKERFKKNKGNWGRYSPHKGENVDTDTHLQQIIQNYTGTVTEESHRSQQSKNPFSGQALVAHPQQRPPPFLGNSLLAVVFTRSFNISMVKGSGQNRTQANLQCQQSGCHQTTLRPTTEGERSL